MAKVSRRRWLHASAAASLTALSYNRVAHAIAAGAKPALAFVGCGGRAGGLIHDFGADSRPVWACDPDQQQLAKFQKRAGEHKAEKTIGDFRRALDDKSIDAVVIATPDHWHAPAAIMACDAGKHVYVEKPFSHNFREGELLVEAVKRNNRVFQHGTQSRNKQLVVDAIHLIKNGLIGEVLACKAWNVQRRRNIGTAKPTQAPAHVDYDTWVGPAEFVPFQSNRYHYEWHWWHNFGTGDIGNDGTHEIDVARWGLGVDGLPESATAIGGKLYFDDDQQFPDTATCIFQWPTASKHKRPKQLIFEMRIWSKNYPHNVDTGIEFYGTEGMLFVSKRGKLRVWDNSNKPLTLPKFDPVPLPRSHQIEFLEAITDGRTPAADVTTARDSCSLVHLANISLRTGRSLRIDRDANTIKDDPQSARLLARTYRERGHWAIPQDA